MGSTSPRRVRESRCLQAPAWLCLTVLACFCTTLIGGSVQEEAFSLLNKETGNVREYFSSNKDNRFLIRVHLWGDIPLSGIHYVPDNATLLDVLGYAGGPAGDFSDTEITVFRPTASGKSSAIKLSGEELASRDEFRNFSMHSGDVVQVDAPMKTDHIMRTLTILSLIASLASTVGFLYVISRNK